MRLKQVTLNDPQVRLSVSVKSSTLTSLEAYRERYLATYGIPIEKSQLVDEIIRTFISEDKAFQKGSAPVAAKKT